MTCNRCGKPRRMHEMDQMTLEPTKCPVLRQEHEPRPGGDY